MIANLIEETKIKYHFSFLVSASLEKGVYRQRRRYDEHYNCDYPGKESRPRRSIVEFFNIPRDVEDHKPETKGNSGDDVIEFLHISSF